MSCTNPYTSSVNRSAPIHVSNKRVESTLKSQLAVHVNAAPRKPLYLAQVCSKIFLGKKLKLTKALRLCF